MRIKIYILAIIAAMVMTACHSTKHVVGSEVAVDNKGVTASTKTHSSNNNAPSATGATIYTTIDRSSLDNATRSLFDEAETWLGVPYHWGGNTRTGIDCSGFVLQVFKSATGIALPRVSYEQYNYCKPINKADLTPGDLVFFATSDKRPGVSHVGLYIGNGHMIHASSKRGVIVADINSNYYSTHYYGSGRVERFHAMRKEIKDVKTNSSKSQSSTPKKKAEVKTAEKKEPQRVEKKQEVRTTESKKNTKAPAHHALHGKPSQGASSTSTADYRKSVLDNLDKNK